MAYDAIDRMTSTQEPFSQVLTFTYDAVGNRTVFADSKGGITTSTYNPVNLLATMKFSGTSTVLREDFTYTARNQVATDTRYKDLAGSQKVGYSTYTYDNQGRITNLQNQNSSGGLIANFTYTYDLADRVTTEVTNGTTVTYQYDATNQLTSDTSKSYTFDKNGNRTMAGYATGTENQLTTGAGWTYTYDNEGNITGKTKGANLETWSFGYDSRNHMLWAKDTSNGTTVTTIATYTYDVMGNRIESDVWTQPTGVVTTRFAYDGGNVWADMDGSNTLQTRYLHGDNADQMLARVSSSGVAAWFNVDRQGSLRNVSDNVTGGVLDTITYDGFGNILSESNAANGGVYKYAGYRFDTETGLYRPDASARYYDPLTGRWTGQDPIGFNAGDGNLQRYVGNGPTNGVDPSGRVDVGIQAFQQSLRRDPELNNATPFKSNGYGTFWINQTIARNKAGWSSRFQFWFVPNDKVDASEIAFVQIIKRTTLTGAILVRKGPDAKIYKERMTAQGWRVDRLARFKSGWYGTSNTLLPGSCPRPEVNSWMRDTPRSDHVGEVWMFEVYAIAKAGPQKGLVYGGVTWGVRIIADGTVTALPNTFLSRPSPDFNKAVEKWNSVEGVEPLGPFSGP